MAVLASEYEIQGESKKQSLQLLFIIQQYVQIFNEIYTTIDQ